MKSYPMYQVDAFADRLFAGNPAAVCPLETWLTDVQMQHIAAENNLSETAFLVPEGEGFRIRWFTPKVEAKLCGHATLASAWVIFNRLGWEHEKITLQSLSGPLSVTQEGEWLTLDFPADSPTEMEIPSGLSEAIGLTPNYCMKGKTDYLLIYENQEEVERLKPDFQAIAQLPVRGIIASAPGDEVDFVSRFFGPAVGVNEDPVTGSAHTLMVPYWNKRLKKDLLLAHQISERGGMVRCSQAGDRVFLSGKGQLYLEGQYFLS